MILHYYTDYKFDLENFTGTVAVTNLDGILIKVYEYKESLLFSIFKPKDDSSKKNTSKSNGCNGSDFCNQYLDPVIVIGRPGANISYAGLEELYGNGANTQGSAAEFGSGSGGSSYSNNNTTEEDRIDNQLTGKADCVFNKLQNVGVNTQNYHNLMTELFVEFGSNNVGGANITFKIGDIGYKGGKTEYLGNGDFSITLSPSMQNSSSIEIATALIHEISHAYLGKRYFLYNASFKELYQKYINENGLGNYSHDIMNDYFVNRMARVLQEFNPSVFGNLNDYKFFAAQKLFEMSDDQKEELTRLKGIAKEIDQTCDEN